MWAVLVSVEVTDAESALATLHEVIIPMVKAAPGFVAGYWIGLDESKATSTVIFESEQQARDAAPPVGPAPNPAVTITDVTFGEVVASA
jgi:hypothetical protein